MTQHEADENKGKEVLDLLTGEVGVLRSRRKVSGGFGNPYWVGVVEFAGGVTRSVWLKKLKLKPAKSQAVKATPKTVSADYRAVVDGLRSCCLATAKAANVQSAGAVAREEACFAGLFKRLFGRKPTAAEIEYVLGGLSAGNCDKCKSGRTIAFQPDGTYGYTCRCTEAVAAVNEFVADKTKKGTV